MIESRLLKHILLQELVTEIWCTMLNSSILATSKDMIMEKERTNKFMDNQLHHYIPLNKLKISLLLYLLEIQMN
jgi:hypothetical protein